MPHHTRRLKNRRRLASAYNHMATAIALLTWSWDGAREDGLEDRELTVAVRKALMELLVSLEAVMAKI